MRGTHWISSGCFSEDVAGASYCHSAYESLWAWPPDKERSIHVLAVLRPNPGNQHDPNAVEVLCEEQRIGFLSRDSARLLHETIGSGGRATWDTTVYAKVTKEVSLEGEITYSAALDLDFGLAPKTGPGSRPRRLSGRMVPFINTYASVRGDHLIIFAPEAKAEVVAMCTPGMEVTCWSPSGSEDIYLYAPGSMGGTGKIGVTDGSFLRRAGFVDIDDFNPIIHSASGNAVVVCAELPRKTR